MDFSLAALKLMCAQLKQAKQIPSQSSSSYTYSGILFQRAWVQGLLISVSDSNEIAEDDNCSRFLLDDGTGVVELSLSQEYLNQNHWRTGMYVMVIGGYVVRAGEVPLIKVHKIVDLSVNPNREAMWYLEVIEAFKLFYHPISED
ncbi:hypothetical protein SOVF_038040 [Spinacia oleracea]|uniref:RecQ-mediated genome instability protein 2 n=1 Tax=Spinacia oleracea TaxID=3562 RepID=A0A9R0I918_SPIOL|nr:uncharacterized protein LOC110783703 [Spinacia oleracea]KNA21992.1 hypothetical protein SOVF_038040 [Spinacia oleracea]